MASSSSDTFCSLDMLAEVASATLQSDPSLSTSSSPRKTRFNSKTGVNSSRKSVNNSEKLSLEQIRTLSDKMLIDMFSELICDEIRKNYSFKCFLIPEKCSQIFKSFGSEARARCKMKVHLQSHISDLLLEANEKTCDAFTAEPLHIRRKRLKEINSKNVRKKKKCKQQNTKKKKEIKDNSDINHVEIKELKSPKTSFQNVDASAFGVDMETSPNGSCEIEKFSNPCTDELKDNSFKQLHVSPDSDLEQSGSNNCKLTKMNNSYNQDSFNQTQMSTNKIQKSSGKKVKRRKEKSFTKSDYVVKWDLDFDSTSIDNSIDFEFDTKLNTDQLPHHDHTYTSVFGKTYHFDEDSEISITPVKTVKKSCPHHIDACMIIPTPPFPYVYVPILPHICEITEIYSTECLKNSKCTCGNDESLLKKEQAQQNDLLLLNEKDLLWHQKNDLIGSEENELDSESTLSDSFLYDDDALSDDPTYEISDKLTNTAFNLDDLEETDCPPNLQSVEKKLALKYIRALRTKKKDERGPLICQICKNKSFTAQATLMYHYRSHAGIKPFSCTVCEATFTRQHSLNYHMLIHYNKSRFVCSDCGRNFRHPSHYKEHLRRHTGETPYECTDCYLRFKTRNTYKRHLKTRHGKILTVNGIHCLPDHEFLKVRTSPRKKINKSFISHKKDQGSQWCIFPEKSFVTDD